MLKRVVVTYIVIIILMLGIIGTLVVMTINTTVREQVIASNQLVLNNGAKVFSDFIKDNKAMILDIAIDNQLQQELLNFDKEKKMTEPLHLTVENSIYAAKLKSIGGFVEIYPYSEEQVYEFSEKNGYQVKEEEQWIKNTVKKQGAFYIEKFEKKNQSFIRMAMIISSIEEWPKKIAIISLSFKTEVMFSLFYNIRLINENLPYLIDSNNDIIFPYDDTYHLSEINSTDYSKDWMINGNDIIVNAPITVLDWTLVGVLPGKQIMRSSRQIESMFLCAGVIVVLILIATSGYFYYRITQPISELFEAMKYVEEDNFQKALIKNQYASEVKILYGKYNYMVERIQDLFERVYISKIKEKEAELLALQQQINPHFLYNTLDSISWMSLKYKAEDIRHMVMSLASMMRYSLNKGNNFILLQDELDQVRNYIAIQEVRYSGKFTTSIKTDSNIVNYKITKLIIQPLVENAIVHGFRDTGEYGHIDIIAKQEINNLKIRVTNTGTQIDLKKVELILTETQSNNNNHYGIRNVSDRVKRQYGNSSHLTFTINETSTIATISIPIYMLQKGESNEKNTSIDS